MTQNEVIALAREVGIEDRNVPALAWGRLETGRELLTYFANAVEAKVMELLLAGAGEPVGGAYLCDACDTPFDGGHYCPSRECGHNTSTKQDVYTADQLAAAVLREREECAKVCDAKAMHCEKAAQQAIENGEQDEVSAIRSTAWQISVCAQAIRARGNT